MPANHRLRSDEEEIPPPVEMQPPDQDPEESVPLFQPKSALRAERYLQLLTQEQVLNDQSPAGYKKGCERSDEQGEEIDHRGSIAAGPAPSGVLPSDSMPGVPRGVRPGCARWPPPYGHYSNKEARSSTGPSRSLLSGGHWRGQHSELGKHRHLVEVVLGL